MDTRLTIHLTGTTDTGRQRTGNEDTFFCGTIGEGRYMLALVVDGCGGYRGGLEAATITRDAVVEYLNDHCSEGEAQLLKHAFVHAGNRVSEARQSDESLRQMCCVATAVLLDCDQSTITMAHVGDTRLYVSTPGRIIKLSRDHSPVGRDEERGYISEDQAMRHPDRNVIERALGAHHLDNDTNYVDDAVYPLTSGLTWLLCTDGLCDMITAAEMNDILSSGGDLAEKADRLVAAANDAGGKDNITVALIQCDGDGHYTTASMMDYYAACLSPDRAEDPESLLKVAECPQPDGTADSCANDNPSTEESQPYTEPDENGCMDAADDNEEPAQPETMVDEPGPFTKQCAIMDIDESEEQQIVLPEPECQAEPERQDAQSEEPVKSSPRHAPTDASRKGGTKHRFSNSQFILLTVATLFVTVIVLFYHSYNDIFIELKNNAARKREKMQQQAIQPVANPSDSVSAVPTDTLVMQPDSLMTPIN